MVSGKKCLMSVVQKGFNSDIQVRGKTVHVQTEDWGKDNPFIVSRVFCGGVVLKTIKTPYNEVFESNLNQKEEAIRIALRQQHNRVIDQLFLGGYY